ncbi:MAG: cytochrome c1 heme lyase [Lasallia pustulata]|uniref:Holocytochrome c-type synthase n=1 Tax=Lasallia pustulata TaxID=136370 RepID=A0A5M8PNW2_9LECA|nr:MAG: cytochrome c1 heme lyase [Lasallia pustulata]
MANAAEEPPPSACPVDPATRALWLEKAKEGRQPPPGASNTATANTPDSTTHDEPTSSPLPKFPFPIPQQPHLTKTRPLASDREISSIPRASPTPTTMTPNPNSPPANSERDTGHDATTGNWIYPSERMFFDAMRRKQHSPQAADMAIIVPIHNAVNERAWAEIKAWEAPYTRSACPGGPRLHSFSGLSGNLTPRARWNSFLGYQVPFDRHDWVVDRCGTRVEYVIDFYAGKDEGKPGKGLNFYLDVRPKLNTWEGWRMRLGRLVGV